MPTDTVAILTYLATQIGYAWLWGLGVAGALFLFALGAAAIKGGTRSVLRHVRALFRF